MILKTFEAQIQVKTQSPTKISSHRENNKNESKKNVKVMIKHSGHVEYYLQECFAYSI